MALTSGKNGRVSAGGTDTPELMSWELDYGPEIHSEATRSGGGGKTTVVGVEDGSGSFEVGVDPASMPSVLFPIGGLVALELWHDTAGTVKATGNGRIEKHKYKVDLKGDTQKCTVSFKCDGTWTLP